MHSDSLEKLLTLKEVANLLQVNERTVYRWVTDKKLPAYKLGKIWRVEEAELIAWLDKQKNKE